MDRTDATRTIFGGYSYQVPLIGDLVSSLKPFRYYFIPNDAFLRLVETATDPYEHQAIYVNEIVQRAHIAAIVSLLRAHRWLTGIVHAYETDNLFVFAASFRGFLESSADSHYVLAPIPRCFSEQAEMFQKCLKKVPKEDLYFFEELEDRLIHFSHARKITKPEIAPDAHRAKYMSEYLDYLQQHGDAGLHKLYSELCEITHPAADSVLCMLETFDGAEIQFNYVFDKKYMSDLLTKYRSSTDWLFAQCISPALMTLGLINLMTIPELYTAALEEIDLSKVGKWKEFSEKVSRAFAVH